MSEKYMSGKTTGMLRMLLMFGALCLLIFILTLFVPGGGRFPVSGMVTAYAADSNLYTVTVPENYLALRTGKSYEYSNEIGKLYPGDTVEVTDRSDETYWYVYAPSLGKYGYVDHRYLTETCAGTEEGDVPPVAGVEMEVKVDSGYLALRNGKSYDYGNEIGRMYSGETVYVIDMNDPDYWTVYSPKLGLTGYTNQNYLCPVSGMEGYADEDYLTFGNYYTYSLGTWYVRVNSGYLALRSARAYDASNEIGELDTGDSVQVIDMTDGDYWYVYAPSLNKYGYVNSGYLY